jgi:hypothetical protein
VTTSSEPPAEIAREDDVHDVLRRPKVPGPIESTIATGPRAAARPRARPPPRARGAGRAARLSPR